MSSQIKTEPDVLPSVVPEVVNGESFLAELGVVRFKWTIKDFEGFLNIGRTISSPSFKMKTTDPSSKVRSFHLEMEIPKKFSNARFPIFLVNETGGEILTKITLEDFGPKNQGGHFPYVYVEHILGSQVAYMPEERKTFFGICLPKGFPKEVTITIKVTLYKTAKKIVS
jgi:hypothetical protein